ncbi:cupredoxin domain-containing protein [Candidatus Daviesbacteria bacterium]|nr:cupredoxin domain-containing protein [Candidatus Daviesbacteria bacterium]
MKSQTIAVAVIILLIAGAAVYFVSGMGNKPADQALITTQPTSNPTVTASDNQTVETFDVKGSPFKFEPNEIKVQKGKTVRINFTNTEGFHDFAIADYDVKTKQLQKDQTDTIEFVADKAGTFEFICTVPTHKDKGMLGKLIVEE